MSENGVEPEVQGSPSSCPHGMGSALDGPIPPAGKCSVRRLGAMIVILVTGLVTAAVVWALLLPGILSDSRLREEGQARYTGEKLAVSFDFRYELRLTGEDSLVEFIIALPVTLDRRQEVKDIHFDPQPQEIFEQGGNRYARFAFRNQDSDLTINITGNALLFGYDLGSATEISDPGVGEDLERYLISERFLEKDDSAIEEAAIGVGGVDDLGVTGGIFDFVLSNMEYSEYNPNEVGAAETLRRKSGDCSEFSDLMVALCRARGIPAKTVEGYIVDDPSGLYVHCWVEVYLEDYGWVPFDPTFADDDMVSFSELQPILLRVSQVRNDDVLGHYHFWYFTFEGDPLEVFEHISFSID